MSGEMAFILRPEMLRRIKETDHDLMCSKYPKAIGVKCSTTPKKSWGCWMTDFRVLAWVAANPDGWKKYKEMHDYCVRNTGKESDKHYDGMTALEKRFFPENAGNHRNLLYQHVIAEWSNEQDRNDKEEQGGEASEDAEASSGQETKDGRVQGA